MPGTLVVIYDHDEETYKFGEQVNLPVHLSNLRSLQHYHLEQLTKQPISKVILIEVNLRYDSARDFLRKYGSPELVEFIIDEKATRLEPFIPPYEETEYPRTYYRADPLTIQNYLKNEVEPDPAIEHCPSCGSPINSNGNDGSCH